MLIRYLVAMVLLIALSVLITACGSAPIINDMPTPTDEIKDDHRGLNLPPRDSIDGVKKSTRAVDQLLVQADIAMEKQQFGRASALVERAIRLAPQAPRAYFSLAQIRYQQGRRSQARSFIEKARTLAVNDSVLLASIVRFKKNLISE